MSKRRPHIDDSLLPPPRTTPEEGESRTSLAVTVLWMLTALVTLMTEVALLGLAGWFYFAPPEGELRQFLEQAFSILALSTAITGTLTLLLTWAACRLRDEPPPVSVVRLAIIIGAFPLATWLLLLLTRGR